MFYLLEILILHSHCKGFFIRGHIITPFRLFHYEIFLQ
nr:MAG TPA: hypothetical protein [Caudoviricetes sp.]